MLNHARRAGQKPTKFYRCACCPNSFAEHEVIHPADGMKAGILAGLACGAASKNLLVGLGVALVAGWAGHLIDQEVTPKCPLCGEVLKLLLSSVLKA